jgi:P4 family phage/plasmid primase-like protien
MSEDDLKLYDLKEIRKAINILFSDVKFGAGECVEVRIFDKRKRLVASGWFDDPAVMAKRVALAARDGIGEPGGYRFIHDSIYWTCNPVNDALLARQEKNVIDFVSENSSDNNVTRRCWLPIDIDPIRPSGVSANKDERKLALDVANTLTEKVVELGFTDNMFVGGTSGNGFHILVRIDLPNDDDSRDLLRDCLKGLNVLGGTGKVEVDPKVFNAARIIKSYGTMARKGMNTGTRPWRLAKLTVVPETIEVAPRELLENLAALAPKAPSKRLIEDRPHGPWTEDNLQKYLNEGTGWECTRQEPRKSNEVCRWVGNCVNDETHKDAAVILHTDGWWSYGCFHASCDHFRYHQFRAYWLERKGEYDFPDAKRKNDGDWSFGWTPEMAGVKETEHQEEIPLYNLTDAGNAERLTWRYRGKFLYCPQRDWYAWNERRWVPDATSAITLAAITAVRKIVPEELPLALAGLDPEKEEDADKIEAICKKYKKWAEESEGQARLNAMSGLAEAFMPVEVHRFDQDLLLFNVNNGTIDLKTGELYPHRREDYLTKISEVNYDPTSECPLWLSFLQDVTAGDEELIRYLQRAVGYSITGLTVEHCMFLLYGTGRNGKSTFLEVVRHIMGDYAKTAHMNTFIAKQNDDSIPNDLAMLHSARFVSATEAEDGKHLAEAKIKYITGGDTVTARFLHKEFFQFTPQFKIWLGTNYKPTIYGTDEGIWRRIRLIPFNVYIPDGKKDEKLLDKLKSEASGILNWALQGLEDYRREGLMEPDIVKGSTEEYRASQDWMTRFLEECTEASMEKDTPARLLYEKYTDWCHKTGEWKLKEPKFAEGMKLKGKQSKRKRQKDGRIIAVYEGLKLRSVLSGFSIAASREPTIDDTDVL